MLTLPSDRPLIVARRGARDHAPENTLPAFELAVEQGADAIEMDVQFTSDGELVLMHGLEVDEVSDGSGSIRGHTFAEIRALDVGSWYGTDFTGLQIPTLAEALDVLAGRIQLILELKSYTRKSEEMEDLVLAEISQRDLLDQVAITSFNPYVLRRLKKLAPDLRSGYMQATGLPIWYSGGIARNYSRADDWHPEYEFVSDSLASKVRQPLWVWPVNDDAALQQALKWNAAALITDDPAWMVEALNKGRKTGSEHRQKLTDITTTIR